MFTFRFFGMEFIFSLKSQDYIQYIPLSLRELIWRLRPYRILFISSCQIGIFLWYLLKSQIYLLFCCSCFCYRKTDEQHGIWQLFGLHCIITKFSKLVIFITISYSKRPISAVIWIQKYFTSGNKINNSIGPKSSYRLWSQTYKFLHTLTYVYLLLYMSLKMGGERRDMRACIFQPQIDFTSLPLSNECIVRGHP